MQLLGKLAVLSAIRSDARLLAKCSKIKILWTFLSIAIHHAWTSSFAYIHKYSMEWQIMMRKTYSDPMVDASVTIMFIVPSFPWTAVMLSLDAYR